MSALPVFPEPPPKAPLIEVHLNERQQALASNGMLWPKRPHLLELLQKYAQSIPEIALEDNEINPQEDYK